MVAIPVAAYRRGCRVSRRYFAHGYFRTHARLVNGNGDLMSKHSEGTAPGTDAQKAAKATGAKHGSGKTAKDTGHVGKHRTRDGSETER